MFSVETLCRESSSIGLCVQWEAKQQPNHISVVLRTSVFMNISNRLVIFNILPHTYRHRVVCM